MIDFRKLSLDTANSGVAEIMFAAALEKICENISDPLFDAEMKRQIVLTIAITPNKGGDKAMIDVSIETKLPKRRSSCQSAAIKDGSIIQSYDPEAAQMVLDDNITPFPIRSVG